MMHHLPKRHHLDKRAAQAADHKLAHGDPDNMLRTKVVAEWLGVSESWLANGRSKGYGPRWIRISPSVIAYRRSDILAWLDGRTHQSTAEYQD